MDDSPELTEDQLWLAVADARGRQRAELLRHLAVVLYLRGNLQDAATTGEEAAAGFAAANLSCDEGFSRYGAGEAYQEMGRPAEALSLFTAAGACFRLSGDEHDCALATHRAGQCLNILGRPQEALSIWDSAHALFASIGAFAPAADVALDRGELLEHLGRHGEALQVLQGARLIRRSLGNAPAVATIDDRIASALIDLGRNTEALLVLRGVLRVRESGTDDHALAYARYRYGAALALTEQHQGAVRVLEAARADYCRLENALGVARCDLSLADCTQLVGQGQVSVELYLRAASVFDALGAEDERLVAGGNLAIAYANMGDHEASASANIAVLSDAERLGNDSLAASIAAQLASSLLHLGDTSQAHQVMAAHPPPKGWHDNIVETSRYQVTAARLLLEEQEPAKAAQLARAVISDLDGERPTSVLAQAYSVLSDLALSAGRVGPGERYRAKAMSLYLAVGLPQEAQALATHFLDPATRTGAHLTAQEISQRPGPG